MNITITGASGFVGQNLIRYLNYSSSCINTLSRSEISEMISFDSNIDTIIHLAGKAHDLKKTATANEYYEVNYELTKKLFDAFLDSKAKKFIFISSVKAAADTVDGVLDENIEPDPQTHYGKSKLMAERYIQNKSLPEGKSYYILRPCMIHGPGNKGNLNLLYRFVKTGIPYPLAGFHNKRSFLSIDNLSFIIKELIIRDDIPRGIYNLSDDGTLTTNEVVSVLAASFNKKPQLWKISPGLIKILAKTGDKLHLPLTTERLNKLTENYVVSNKKIKDVINKPLPLTIVEGLTLTAASFNKT